MDYQEISFDLFDDVSSDNDGHRWTQVCEACCKKLHLDDSMLSPGDGGICGLIGCGSESDFYLDWDDRQSD